ncbi:hypothetical protein CK203_095850 [Vitis vinifera]|uniref:Uncharacterized protein n=1 Tax=Vitis vinifera TaxID=29760 RepID=A0A438CK64_VITVI|nr:hypothetical protein CK203_095850 [Vitis vinifera]
MLGISSSDLVLQVRCRELKRADRVAFPLRIQHGRRSKWKCFCWLSYSIEIKDAYIPPWIIFSISATMGSEGGALKLGMSNLVTFCNEPTSIALNAAVETVGQKSDTQGATGEGIQESTYAFGIPDAVVTSFMHSAFLKGLKIWQWFLSSACLSPV